MLLAAMAARVLKGNEIAADLREEVAAGVADLVSAGGPTPGLAAVLVGNDPASGVYVRNKGRACEEAGIFSEIFYMPADVSQANLLSLIDQLNRDTRFHGILVQLPLPNGLDEHTVIERVDPSKDVDGLHPTSQGRVLQGEPAYLPCTPSGVQQVLLRSGYDPAGQHVVIVGRSNIVGKPLAALLMQRAPGGNATVTVCHTRTRNLPDITRQADILVAAMGVPGPSAPTWCAKARWSSTWASTGWMTPPAAAATALWGTLTTLPSRQKQRQSPPYPAASAR